MASISIHGLNKSFGTTSVLRDIDLVIDDGEFMTLVGPSGCGKSTLLRIVAGLEEASSGSVRIAGRAVDGLRPSDRDLSMVFQSYALYPHLTVAQNIAVPLRMRRLSTLQRLPLLGRLLPGSRAALAWIAEEVEQAAQMLDITHLLGRKPSQLSGGQRQRVALGRAMVRHPQAFLMDEPLSNLDAKLRVHMRTEIAQLHRRLGTTFLYVTHDQAEAMTMSDRVAVMMDGLILQCDAPDRVYDDPAHLRVAEFIGSPRINVVHAMRVAGGVALGDRPLNLGAGLAAVALRSTDARLTLAFRAEHATLGDAATAPLRGVVTHLENLGPEVLVHIDAGSLADGPIVVRIAPQAVRPALGEAVGVVLRERAPMLFGERGERLRAGDAHAEEALRG